MLLGKGARSGIDVRTVLRKFSVNAGATSPEMDSPTRPTPFAMSERNIGISGWIRGRYPSYSDILIFSFFYILEVSVKRKARKK